MAPLPVDDGLARGAQPLGEVCLGQTPTLPQVQYSTGSPGGSLSRHPVINVNCQLIYINRLKKSGAANRRGTKQLQQIGD